MVDLSAYPWVTSTPNVWMILRRSQEDPDDPDILAKHRRLLLRLAAAYGVSVPAARIVEEIESGDTIAGRPRFSATLSEWERLPYGAGMVIFSTEVARLTRGLQSDQGRVQNAIARAHGLHITPARCYDLRIPDHATAWELEGFVARLELRAFKWRMRLAADELLARGRTRNGRAPFGWRWDPREKDWVADPDRFPLVVSWCRDIFTLSLSRIAARDGVSIAQVYKTLTNPAVCGWPARRTALHHGARAWRFPVAPLPREEWQWPLEEGRYPKACTREEWEQVQAVLAERGHARAKTGTAEEGWCRDVVEFVDVPGRVRLGSQFLRPGERLLTYERVAAGEPHRCVSRAVVHAAAQDALARVCRDPAALARGLSAWESEAVRSAAAAGGRRGDLSASLARARRALDEATRLAVECEDPEERAAGGRVRAEKAGLVRALKRELASLPPDRPSGPAASLSPASLSAIAAQFEPAWEAADGETRRGLVNAVIARIPVAVVAPHRPRRVGPVVLQPWVCGE
jgi:hypothetical protein